jgi:hypothetical protein
MARIVGDRILCPIPCNIDERERLSQWQSQIPLAARVSAASLVSVADSVRPTEITAQFISAQAALPLSRAWSWSLCRIAMTIVLTCGIEVANRSGRLRCDGKW